MNMKLRNAGKALIQKDDRILVTVNRDEEGLWYILPGGGINVGEETIVDALKRECLEEVGAEVTVQGWLFYESVLVKTHVVPIYSISFFNVLWMMVTTWRMRLRGM